MIFFVLSLFVFKQKTAYEMRISDWSSDVCSSDLVVTPDLTHPNSNYPQFARFVLQKVAASLGISYPQLSQDWSSLNYSSARALLNEIWRGFLEDRDRQSVV